MHPCLQCTRHSPWAAAAGLCNISSPFGWVHLVLTIAFCIDIVLNFNVAVWDARRKRSHRSRKCAT